MISKKQAYMKMYREKNKEKIKLQKRNWRIKNKEKIILSKREYYKNNKEKVLGWNKKHYLNNKEKIIKQQEIKRKSNPIPQRIVKQKYYQKYKPRFLSIRKKYFQDNKKSINERMNSYHINRRKNDPIYNLIGSLRSRLGSALNRYTKNGKVLTSDEYGINYQDLSEFLVATFPVDWSERSEWHIDHIIPVDLLNDVREENIQLAIQLLFSRENLQWMVGIENSRKNDTIPTNLSPESKNILEQINRLKKISSMTIMFK